MTHVNFRSATRPAAVWLLVGFALLPAVVAAQSIVVTPLSGGAGNSIAYAISAGSQVGFDGVSAAHATLWTGTAASAVDLNPAGAFSSLGYAASATQQGGRANFSNVNGTDHAAVWSGTAISFVDLHPVGAASSVVTALTATQQGGSAMFAGLNHAYLWSGNAASGVDLQPAGATSSQLTTMTATQQGGVAGIGSAMHAGLWSGTAASFVDLNPSGATDSTLYAMTNGNQGGVAYFATTPHAGLWSGTAGSFVDLDAGTAGGSVLYAMAGGYQVGAALMAGGASHAALWQGSSASFLDLHSVISATLGGNYKLSTLRGAEVVGSTLFLVGDAEDPMTSGTVAFLVTAPVSAVPEPAVAALCGGLAAMGLVATRRRWFGGLAAR